MKDIVLLTNAESRAKPCSVKFNYFGVNVQLNILCVCMWIDHNLATQCFILSDETYFFNQLSLQKGDIWWYIFWGPMTELNRY